MIFDLLHFLCSAIIKILGFIKQKTIYSFLLAAEKGKNLLAV